MERGGGKSTATLSIEKGNLFSDPYSHQRKNQASSCPGRNPTEKKRENLSSPTIRRGSGKRKEKTHSSITRDRGSNTPLSKGGEESLYGRRRGRGLAK